MRRRPSILPLALGLALAAAPVAASACSPAPGSVVPTNLQLADAATLIVLGEVVAGGQGTAPDPGASTITIHAVAALKGPLPRTDLVLPGMAIADPGDEAAFALSDPLAFGDPHPQALAGSCVRRVFPLGARAVFFLRRDSGRWVPAGGAFSRWAEDIADAYAPWVTLANLYAQASLLPPQQAREKLQEQRAAMLDHEDDPVALAMAADLDRSLAGPSRPLIGRLPPLVSQPAEAASGAGEAVDSTPSPWGELENVDRAIDAFGRQPG